ncbi:MAG: TRAP transporter small permease, partial [Aquincola sp.]|nr:TRAP transporter small permease [Aquincola sp.]
NDISTGNDATPLWIPQLGMAVGTLILFIAFVDEFVLEWRSRRARVLGDGELVRNE